MQKSLFGIFTAFLGVICFICSLQAFQKRRFGLGTIFILNAFTNLVNSIHAFSGVLF